jgi:hypothetical protein
VEKAFLRKVVLLESRRDGAAGKEVVNKKLNEGDLPIGEFA